MLSNWCVVAVTAIFVFASVDAESECTEMCSNYHRVCPGVLPDGTFDINKLDTASEKNMMKARAGITCIDPWLSARCPWGCGNCTKCESEESAALTGLQKEMTRLDTLEKKSAVLAAGLKKETGRSAGLEKDMAKFGEEFGKGMAQLATFYKQIGRLDALEKGMGRLAGLEKGMANLGEAFKKGMAQLAGLEKRMTSSFGYINKITAEISDLGKSIKGVRSCSCKDDKCNECRSAPANHWDCNGQYYDKDVWQPANVLEPTCTIGGCGLIHTVVKKQSTVNEARKYCKSLGAILPEPLKLNDMKCFKGISGSNTAVFGLTDANQEGVWRNAAGKVVTNYIKVWRSGAQSTTLKYKEDCSNSRPNFGNTLNDCECDRDFPDVQVMCVLPE